MDEIETASSPKAAPSSVARSRSGTLSWQQRPSSRDFNRHSFMSTSPTRQNRLRAISSLSNRDQEPSRIPTAPSSPSKDVFVFPQTPERGLGSPILRKNIEEDTSEATPNINDQRTPEGKREGNTELDKQIGQQDADERSRSPSRASSTFAESSLGQRYSSVSSVSTAAGLGSPAPLANAPKLEPRTTEPSSEEQIPTSPSQRRRSPERPSSPTKGLGGFVQSAMMKRSDSVSKRWSAQIPQGLSRGNSFASNRNSIAGFPQGDSLSASPPKLGREAPSFPLHRPSSSHSEATVVHNAKANERPATPPVPSNNSNTKFDDSPSRLPLSIHTRSASTLSKDGQGADSSSQPPTSPAVSRTMDPRRWSPTKASWLESALNRPDSPKHKKQPSQTAPWVRERQSRGSVDLGRANSFKEVTPVGLMRTTAPGSHFKKSSISGIPDILGNLDTTKGKDFVPEPIPDVKEGEPVPADKTADAPSVTEKGPQQEPEPEATEETAAETPAEAPEEKSTEAPIESPVEKSAEAPTEKPAETKTEGPANPKLSPLSVSTKLNPTPPSTLSPREPLSPRPKPQSPVVDFRGNLRRREVVKDNAPKAEPEFKNVFGKLKKTEKVKHEAPDELKDNILRGKAALNATGGPKKSERVDELKDSILKQKEAIKFSGGSLRRNTVGDNDAPEKSIPEAIAKRNNMTKSGSVKSDLSADAQSSPSPKEPATPSFVQEQPTSPFAISDDAGVGNTESQQPAPIANKPDPEESQYEITDFEIPQAAPQTNDSDPEEPQEGIADTAPLETTTEEAKGDDSEEKLKNDDSEAKKEDVSEETIKPVRELPSGTVAEVAKAPPAAEGLATKGKLAGRINPALAGLLSRGPPVASDEPKKALSTNTFGEGSLNSSDRTPAAPLTHMTKGRARGPKRRLPNTAPAEATPKPVSPSVSSIASFDEQGSEASISPVEHTIVESSNWPLPEDQGPPPSTEPVQTPFQSSVSSKVELRRSIQSNISNESEKPNDQIPEPVQATFRSSVSSKPVELRRSVQSSISNESEQKPNDQIPKPVRTPFRSSVSSKSVDSRRSIQSSISNEYSRGQNQDDQGPEPVQNPLRSSVSGKSVESMRSVQSSISKKSEQNLNDQSPEPVQSPLRSSVSGKPVELRKSIPSEPSPPPAADPVQTPVRSSISRKPAELRRSIPNEPEQKPNDQGPPPITEPVQTPLRSSVSSKPVEPRESIQSNIPKEPEQKPINDTPKSTDGLNKLPLRSSELAYEDIENLGDSPSNKPAVPPKPAPSPLTPMSGRSSQVQYSSPSPSPLRTSLRENKMDSPTTPRSVINFVTGGIRDMSSRNKALPSPPVASRRSDISLDQQFSSPRSSASLVPQADETMEVISNFFKPFPHSSDRVDIDPQLMLTSKGNDLKIRTLRKQIWEITSDGKRQDLPINQEYILYEGSMYLCIHMFELDGGTRSEAHLWCGDDVQDSSLDDAQVFARKAAKDNGCKLEIIKQGKEPAQFIQALGGILITRRGSNSRSSSSALYMLCGRKHLKQMVFDEVDFSRSNLCSGYPFVISAMFGNLYLWKGKGSSAEEIGAARLIGMDLGLTGEIEEIAEGEEPETFSEIFPDFRDTGDYMRSDYWQRKPNHDHFRTRLLRVDHGLGQRSGFWIRRPGSSSPVIRPNDTVQEVEPYCHKDLAAKGIYILDTFFEIYV
ncbi:hypothetical protein AWENTII_010433 [Aspergillus wentii]